MDVVPIRLVVWPRDTGAPYNRELQPEPQLRYASRERQYSGPLVANYWRRGRSWSLRRSPGLCGSLRTVPDRISCCAFALHSDRHL